MPWRREWLLTPVFWPGEFHGQGSLTAHSPWPRKGSDMTERPSLHFTSPLPKSDWLHSPPGHSRSTDSFSMQACTLLPSPGTSLVAQMVKTCLQCGRPRFSPWVGKISWRRKWQPTPVFLLGKSHGWRSLVAYSPWGPKESDTTEPLHFHFPFPLA